MPEDAPYLDNFYQLYEAGKTFPSTEDDLPYDEYTLEHQSPPNHEYDAM